ncbi:MAG: hypothetical protein ACIAQZ_17135 [Sedimentisphaeraceae bacterium JB056]
MLRLFQITSFVLLAVSIAVGAWVLLDHDNQGAGVDEFLESPLTAETYKGNLPSNANNDGAKAPLVAEAEALSLRLNPPAPKLQRPSRLGDSTPRNLPPQQTLRPQKPVIAKFDLLGTCVNTDRPELSMIYINVPGEGRKWVYQGQMVGRLKIDEVKAGSVIYSDGGVENELPMLEQMSEVKSLLKSEVTDAGTQAAEQLAPAPADRDGPSPAAVTSPSVPPARRTVTRRPQPTAVAPRPAPIDPTQQKETIEDSLKLMSQMKSGSEEGDKELTEAMQKMQEMMKNAEMAEAMQKAAEK